MTRQNFEQIVFFTFGKGYQVAAIESHSSGHPWPPPADSWQCKSKKPPLSACGLRPCADKSVRAIDQEGLALDDLLENLGSSASPRHWKN